MQKKKERNIYVDNKLNMLVLLYSLRLLRSHNPCNMICLEEYFCESFPRGSKKKQTSKKKYVSVFPLGEGAEMSPRLITALEILRGNRQIYTNSHR